MKYVLISQQGSGSNLFRAFMNSHPNIHFGNEIFCSRKKVDLLEYAIYDDFDGGVEEFLDKFYNRKEKVVGYDLKYNQMTPSILEYIKENNIKVIHLKRNAGRTFLRQVNNVNNSFTHAQLKAHCKQIERWQKEIDEMFPDRLEIYYEDMTRGQEIESLPSDFQERILKYFGVLNIGPLRIDEKYTTKKLKIRY